MKNLDKNNAVALKFVNKNKLIYFEKHFYLYNEGIWRLESDENTEAWISQTYSTMYEEPPSSQQIKEIIKMITTHTYAKYRKEIKYRNEILNIGNTINTKSGILNLDTLKLKEYKFEDNDFCFYKLPFDYSPVSICPPVMRRFLTTSLGYEESGPFDDEYQKLISFVQEWIGYTLTGGNLYHKALILYGEGGNGKGVLTDIWEYIVGRFNCSFVDIRYLNDGSQIFMTRNKLINFSKDLENDQQLDTGTIKSAVAGETLIANEKYKGQIEITFTAKMVIACNELPFLRSAGNAVRRRFYILPFLRVLKEDEQDRYLFNKLKDEAQQIFSWAVQGYKNLKARGGFDSPGRCVHSLANYVKNNDSVQVWIEEGKLFEPEGKSRTVDTLKDYTIFCELSGMKALGRNKFHERMELKGYTKKVFNGVEYFTNIRLNTL